MIKILLIFTTLIFQQNNSKYSNDRQDLKKAYFASGCFWCVEGIYESLKGVKKVDSGYSGGFTKNPTYYQVMSGSTGHAEVVEVVYDPNLIEFKTLVKVFFGSHDPTTLNRQGPDLGTQYRSIAFYSSKKEELIIRNEIQNLLKNKVYNKITTQVLPFKKFYKAESYHQDYKKKNPNDLYIMRISNPRIKDFKIDFKDLIK